MATVGWKSRSNRANRRKSCLTCHFSHNNSPMDCSGNEGGSLQWNRTPESLWCTPIRNCSNFWSACTVLSAIGRRGVSDVSTKFISSVTLGDPSFISHRASGPAALCRPISWEAAVPFFIAITRRTSGLRISCVLFSTVVSHRTHVRVRALSCHIMNRSKPNEENWGSHSAEKNTVFSNVTPCRNLHRLRRNLPLPSSGQVRVWRLRLQGRKKSRLISDHMRYVSDNSVGKRLTCGKFWINMLRSANEGWKCKLLQ